MQLSVIIVNYNVKYFLEQCLYSVIKACKNLEAEIFVVDNASTDGSENYLSSKFPLVKFSWNKTNIGFGAANNSVLQQTKGAYILFLNPDTIVPEDCFDSCIAFFKSHTDAGALGVKMIDGAGHFLKESKRCFPSPTVSFFKMAGLADMFPQSKLFAKYYASHISEDATAAVEVLPGAFMMISREALHKVSGFDERFFMYAEDIDLSYRIQQAGLKNFYFPEIPIIHFKGESTKRVSASYVQQFYGAMQLFVKKHYKEKKGAACLLRLAIMAGMLLAYGKLVVKKITGPGKKSYTGNRETLVVATQDYFNKMIQLIKYAKEPLVLQGRVSVEEYDRSSAVGYIDNIADIVSRNKTGIIVFCEASLSYKKMIQVMLQLKGEVNFLFHAGNSDSIAGSNDKNDNGMIITK